jgi:predicted transcriptional regulator
MPWLRSAWIPAGWRRSATRRTFLHCRTDILISVKPQYLGLMVSGDKTVELRRRVLHVPAGTRVWIYATVPSGWVGAVGEVSHVHENTPRQIWNRFRDHAGVSKQAFFSYFNGSDRACAVVFHRIRPLSKAIHLEELRQSLGSFRPPQFYKKLEPRSDVLALFLEAI